MDTASARPDFPVAFVDSSAIVTLIDQDDASHQAAVDAYRSLVNSGYRLFTTNHVLDEAFELLTAGIGVAAARRWLSEHRLAVYHIDETDLAAAVTAIATRPVDAPISLTDALSMAVMERLGVSDAFAVDPAFLAELS
ncbi:MAG: PIN domain-containing protein [Thermomicrobiales bacterium]|nr:PIN domain-containing protein [Thermomicrobiales bacterium]